MRRASALVALLALLGAGCTPSVVEGGEDRDYLKDPPPPEAAPINTATLLPLNPGNYWDMLVATERNVVRERLVVVGPLMVGKEQGVLLELQRSGKVWRQEVYQSTAEGIRLLAFGEKRSQLLVLNPPFPIAPGSAQEGQGISWKGTLSFGNNAFPATGYSRVTLKDTIQTRSMGRFQAYRIDSVVTMRRKEGPLHFPQVRWLYPGIGFIRRSYADAGLPASAELERYQVAGTKK